MQLSYEGNSSGLTAQPLAAWRSLRRSYHGLVDLNPST